MADLADEIDPAAPPSGEGCATCLGAGGWWFHLRRCAKCGRVGCCDSSPGQHARRHYEETGHRVMASFEPGEWWFWDFAEDSPVPGPELAAPRHHPEDQPVPGPEGRVPADWESHLH
jgi:hypothetical protein